MMYGRVEMKMRAWTFRLPMLILLILTFLSLERTSNPASAHLGDPFGPACGAATIDGVVESAEWSSAAAQTFLMESPNIATPLTATLRIMNGANNLYLGITIEDDEFSPTGEFLPQGDGFRIDFDDDHGGVLFDLGDEALLAGAGSPQFIDAFITGTPAPDSSDSDITGGGTSNGAGAASRIGTLNHFELVHPLCSGDLHDFCLQPGDVVGFRLEYLDAEADGSFGGSVLFPGFEDTSTADMVIGPCSTADLFIYLPVIER